MNYLAYWYSEFYRAIIKYVRDYLVVTCEALEHINGIINDQIISSELINIMLNYGNNNLDLAKLILRQNPIPFPIYHDFLTINASNR